MIFHSPLLDGIIKSLTKLFPPEHRDWNSLNIQASFLETSIADEKKLRNIPENVDSFVVSMFEKHNLSITEPKVNDVWTDFINFVMDNGITYKFNQYTRTYTFWRER